MFSLPRYRNKEKFGTAVIRKKVKRAIVEWLPQKKKTEKLGI